MKELTDFLDKRGVEYTIDGEHVLVPGDVRLICPKLTHLPESFGNLKVGGGVCFIDGIVREIISRKVGR